MRNAFFAAPLFFATALASAGCSSVNAADDLRQSEGAPSSAVYYALVARHSGKVLDVSGGSTANGANVQQWSNNGSAAQRWRFDPVGDGYFEIRAKCSGKALDVQGDAMGEGANVQQWDYGGGANQQWKLEDAGGGYVRVRARHSGLYLDVAWAGKADGTNVAQVNYYPGDDAQQWMLVADGATDGSGGGGAPDATPAAPSSGDYVLHAEQSGRCLDVPASSIADGAKLQQWTCNGTSAQTFHVEALGGGAYEITNTNSGKALDITDVSLAAGAPLQQWGYGGGRNQQFTFTGNPDGTFAIKALHSGLALDVAASATTDGTPIVQWPWHDGANQHWRLAPTSGATGGGGGGGVTAPPGGMHLVWSDEFDGSGLPDPNKWGYDVGGGGWGNHEAEFYTANRLENARVEGGNLVIEARREDYGGEPFTSARLASKNDGSWLYGRVDVRAKIPAARGTWPAIWMLSTDWKYGGWPNSGELDIMEHVGFDPGVIHGSIHTQAYNHTIGTQKTATQYVGDATSAFHTYSTEWTAEGIDIFVDDVKYFSFANEHSGPATWPFDQRFHLLLNIAVGGDWGAVKGIDEGAFPQRMEVDYVRVYQR